MRTKIGAWARAHSAVESGFGTQRRLTTTFTQRTHFTPEQSWVPVTARSRSRDPCRPSRRFDASDSLSARGINQSVNGMIRLRGAASPEHTSMADRHRPPANGPWRAAWNGVTRRRRGSSAENIARHHIPPKRWCRSISSPTTTTTCSRSPVCYRSAGVLEWSGIQLVWRTLTRPRQVRLDPSTNIHEPSGSVIGRTPCR